MWAFLHLALVIGALVIMAKWPRVWVGAMVFLSLFALACLPGIGLLTLFGVSRESWVGLGLILASGVTIMGVIVAFASKRP